MPASIYQLLDDDQKDHYVRLMKVFGKYNCAFDLSRMGAGKTWTAGAMIDGLDLPNVLIICPVSVMRTWNMFFEEHSKIFLDRLAFKSIISYESLRGNISKNSIIGSTTLLADGILESNIVYEKEKKINVYRPTDKLKILCREGLVVVLDEAHRAKNVKTLTCDSVCAVLECLNDFNPENKSKSIMMSGTLFDKKEHVFSISKALGVYKKEDKMVKRVMGNVVHAVVDSLRLFISKHVPEKTSEFDNIVKTRWLEERSKTGSSAAKFSEAVFFDAMINIVIPEVSSVITVEDESENTTTATSPTDSSSASSAASPKKFLNCGILLTKSDTECSKLDETLNQFSDMVSLYTKPKEKKKGPVEDGVVEGVEPSSSDAVKFGHIIKILETIENKKVPHFVEHTKRVLDSGRSAKMVIAFNYKKSIAQFCDAVREQNIVPLKQLRVVTGETTMKARGEAFDSFQSDDSDSCLIIVAITKVIALGVSLDDQTGVYQRYALTSPSYMAIDQHQFIRRFFRKKTKSVANVFFIYARNRSANGDLLEQRLLRNITAKSDVIKKISAAAGDDTTKTVYMSDFAIVEDPI